MAGGQLVQLVVEDHRVAVAVGVEHPDRPLRAGEEALGDRHDRRDAAAAAECRPRAARLSCTQKTPAGFVVSRTSPSDTWSRSQFETMPPGDALDGHGQVAVGLRSARHRVAAQVLVAVDVDAEGAELPGQVAKGVRELRGDVKHERARVGGLLDDALDAQRVVPVGAPDLIVVNHGWRHRPRSSSWEKPRRNNVLQSREDYSHTSHGAAPSWR